MGALLRGIKREQVVRGQVLIAPGSMESVKTFKASVYVSLTLISLCGSSSYCTDPFSSSFRSRSRKINRSSPRRREDDTLLSFLATHPRCTSEPPTLPAR